MSAIDFALVALGVLLLSAAGAIVALVRSHLHSARAAEEALEESVRSLQRMTERAETHLSFDHMEGPVN